MSKKRKTSEVTQDSADFSNFKRIENNLSKKLNLKPNQIVLSGKHSILSAIKNGDRKLHYLLLTQENALFWQEQLQNLNH